MARRTTEVTNSDALKRLHASAENRPSSTGGTGLYALYVFDLDRGKILRQFVFDVSPQVDRLDEDAAAEVVATQENGFWTDERGQYFKILNVSGTFGFRPSPLPTRTTPPRATPQQNVTSGQASVQQVARGTATQDPFQGELTGFDRFLALENLFRFYWDRKGQRSTSGITVMVWANWKMGEVYIAQPLRFGRDRSAPSGRTKIAYNFNIRLLAPLDVTLKPQDYLISPSSPRGKEAALSAIQEVSGTLEDLKNTIEKAATLAIDSGVDLQKSVVSIVSDALDSVSAFFNKVDGAFREGQSFLFGAAQFPVEKLREVHRTALDVAGLLDAAKTSFERSSLLQFERSSLLQSDLSRSLKSLARKVQSVFVGLVSGYQGDVNDAAASYGDRYKRRDSDASRTNDGVPLSRTRVGDAGSQTSLGGRVIPRGSTTIQTPRDVTIKTIAVEYLGSAGRWKEIALLNNLQAPYISPNGDGITVLRPGDPLLLPIEPQSGRDENNVFSSRDDIKKKDARRYGRDLRINLETRDLEVDERGDIATVEGLENLIQSAHIKIFTKPKSLRLHPWFGFGAEIGEGTDIERLSRYQLLFRMTLLSDPRYEKIDSLSLRVDGDILLLRAKVYPKESDDSLTLDLSSRVR